MALMKTTRGGEPTVKSKRGEYKPNAENASKLAAYDKSMSEKKASEDKYKSDVETYSKQKTAYASQPKNRDMTTLFQGGGRYLNAKELETWNKEQEVSGASKSRGGLKASKVFVSKGYGTEGAGKSPLSSDKSSYSGYKGAFHEFLDKPGQAPSKKEFATPAKPKLGVEKMPLYKIESIKSGPKKLAQKEEKEKWNAPGKTKVIGIEKYATNKKGEVFKVNPLSKTVENVKRGIQYKKELKGAKAYFGGSEGKTASDIAEKRAELRGERKDLKQAIKDVRKGTAAPIQSMTKAERIQGYKSMAKGIKGEEKQTKLASKYVKAVGKEYMGVKAGEKTENAKFGSKVRFATPEAMVGYKESMNNPTNRNTMEAKIKAEKKK